MEIEGVQVVDGLRGRQVRLLLAYLILNRSRSVGREELSAALWPFTAPQSQDGALRTLLSRLRSAVGASVLHGRDQLVLNLPEPVWIDVEAARTQVARAVAALEGNDLRAAWALAQVPLNVATRGLLPGIEAPWLEAPRRELLELRLQALEVIGRAGLGLGGAQLASAERAARALIAAEPYRESAYTLLMEALAAQGNIAEGMRVFDQLRTLLRSELGTLPSPDALAIHDQLLNPQGRTAPDTAPSGEEAIGLPAELATRALALLVGRSAEMSELERLWELASSGQLRGPIGAPDGGSRVVVVAGDPGVGKTRLVAELARRVHERGAVVLAGRAPEESLVPYQPFLEALRHYIVNAPLADLRTVAREYGSELVRLVPDLRRRVPDLVAEDAGDPDTERYRLFEAVVGLLSAIARRAPILLVLDDVHWADRPTLLLLRHLARAADPRRLLILTAYRAIESAPDGFTAVLADLHREGLLTDLQVGGLSQSETAALVRLRTGEAPSRPFARALHRETEGNPLFIEEMVRHLSEAGVRPRHAVAGDLQRFGLPEGVKQVIARRLSRFEATATEWLRVAAVIGRDFDAGLLEDVLGAAEAEFLDVLEQALDSGLVVEGDQPGRYSFSHALIREVLYEGMSAPRRARLHRRVGEALEARAGDEALASLAYHFTRAATAADAARAVAYARAAGERASAMLAHEEAAEHYGRAIEVLERFLPKETESRTELLLLAGEAQARAGDPALAWPALESAAQLAEQLGDGATVARAAIAASRRYMQRPGVVEEKLIALLERALEMNPGEQSNLRVLLLARLCGALYFSPRRDRMIALSEEAQTIAEAIDEPEARLYAASARRRALWDPAHLEQRLAASTQMLQLAHQVGNLDAALHAHVWLVVDLLEKGEPEAVEAQIDAFGQGAARLREPAFEWHALVWSGMRALLAGRLSEAEARAEEALTVGGPAEAVSAAQYYAIQLLGIRREQGRMGELEPAARAFIAANPTRPGWRAALAEMLALNGDADGARSCFDELAARDFADVPFDGDWLTSMVLAADIAVALEDRPRCERLYELLLPYREQSVVIGLGAACLGAISRPLGALAAALGRREPAAEHFESALALNARLDAVVELAHTRLQYASLLGHGTRARELIIAAQRTAEALELPRVAEHAARLRGR